MGKQQQFELGQYMRDRYAKLLGDGRYTSKKIYIQSTVIESHENIEWIIMLKEHCNF